MNPESKFRVRLTFAFCTKKPWFCNENSKKNVDFANNFTTVYRITHPISGFIINIKINLIKVLRRALNVFLLL